MCPASRSRAQCAAVLHPANHDTCTPSGIPDERLAGLHLLCVDEGMHEQATKDDCEGLPETLHYSFLSTA